MEFVKPINRDDWGDPDPANKIPGAVPPAKAFSQTMTEMVNVITSAGLTPSGEDLTQFDQAIKALVQKKVDEANMLAVSNTVYQRNIGDFIFTNNKMRGTKATGSLNGAYECNGDEFSETDFEGESTPYQLLVAGNLPSVTYAKYAEILNKYGNCGYYALDTAAKKFKIPTIKTAFLQAGTPGEFKEAGLPSIDHIHTVNVSSDGSKGGADTRTSYLARGFTKYSSPWSTNHNNGENSKLINASTISNPIFGKSETVQPAAVCARVMVQLANEIDNATSIESYIEILKQLKEDNVTAVNEVAEQAISDISSAHTTGVAAVNTAKTSALEEINAANAAGKEELEKVKESAIYAVSGYREEVEEVIDKAMETAESLESVTSEADKTLAALEENVTAAQAENAKVEKNVEDLTNLNNTAAVTVQTVTEKAEAAAESATAAKTSETNAKTSETNAKASETAAGQSQTAAASSASAAAQSATAAKTSEDNAKTAETNAKASETLAKQYRDEAAAIINVPSATETVKGLVYIASTADVTAGTDDTKAITSAKLKPVVSPLAKTADLTAHTGNKSNPHGVTKAQVGLGNVDNTADANKPVSAAQKSYVDNFQPAITTLTAASGTLTLAVNKVYSVAITGNTTFSLPTPGNKNVFNQIKVMLKVTGTPTVNWGTTQFFNKTTPEIEAGCYDVYFDFDKNLNAWVCGAMPKGAAS